MPGSGTFVSGRIARWGVDVMLYLTVVGVVVPLSPMLPASGLDPSWALGVNQAVAQNLTFGTDVIFTYGPYTSVFSTLYHPQTDARMLWGGLLVAFCYALALQLVVRGRSPWLRLSCVALVAVAHAGGPRDAVFASYLLVLALAVWRLREPLDAPARLGPTRAAIVWSLLLVPLGLLPLAKCSFFAPIGLLCVIFAISFWRDARRRLAVLTLVIPPLALVVFWLVAGQPLSGLPRFVWTSWLVIAGYTEAMALSGPELEVFLFLASAALLLGSMWRLIGRADRRLFLVLSCATCLFFSFKSGFVRHDGHAVIAGASLLFATLPVMLLFRGRSRVALLVTTAAAGTLIINGHSPFGPGRVADLLVRPYVDGIGGLVQRVREPQRLPLAFAAAMTSISRELPLPRLSGTTDIYPVDQAYLLASGNTWTPRPVLQSYSAYHPELARLDSDWLEGARAPDHILFRVDPLDGHYPSIEDGPSWRALLTRYEVSEVTGGTGRPFVILDRKAQPEPPRRLEWIHDRRHSAGEDIALPTDVGPLFAELDVSPTLIGMVAGVLFKVPPLGLTVHLSDGAVLRYRISAGAARAGFLLSPLVGSTTDFVLLTARRGDHLSGKVVRSINVATTSPFWSTSIGVRLARLHIPRDTDVERLGLFDKDVPAEGLPTGSSILPIADCDGFIDLINGTGPGGAALIPVTKTLSLAGWVAVAAQQGTLPDAAVVVLSSEAGSVRYLNTRRTLRPDVAAAHHLPQMAAAGYEATIDISDLQGRFDLGLAWIYQGKLQQCRQIKIPLVVTN